MRIKLLLAILFVGNICLLHAQDSRRISMELTTGPSFPVGKLAEKRVDQNPANTKPPGNATPGLNAELTGAYTINQAFAALLQLKLNVFGQDKQAYRQYLEQQYGSDVQTKIDLKNRTIISVLGGLAARLPVQQDKIFLATRLSAGVAKTAVPGYKYSWYDGSGLGAQGGSAQATNRKLPWSFCYQAAVGLQYHLSPDFYLTGDINYFRSRPQIETVYYPGGTSSPSGPVFLPGQGPAAHATVRYELSAVGVGVGLGLRL